MNEVAYWAIALLGACWLTALLIVRIAYPKIDKYLASRKAMTVQAIANTGNALNTAFVELFDKNFTYRKSHSGMFHVDKFFDMLQAEFPQLEIHTQMCNLQSGPVDPYWCTSILKLGPNIECLLQYNFDRHEGFDSQRRPVFKFANGEPLEAGPYNVANSLEVLYSGETGEFAHQRIAALQHECKVEYVTYESPERKIRMYRVRSFNSNYSVSHYELPVPRQSKEYLNMAYCEPEFEFAGETHRLPMSDMVEIMCQTLESGENIQLYGPTGTGKSRLLDQICSDLTHKSKNVICVSLTPSIFNELGTAEAQASLLMALTGLKESTNAKIVFTIDEAESLLEQSTTGVHTANQAFLLRLMAGDIQLMLGCSTILAYNADPSKLNSKVFRKGRTSMLVKLLPIKREQGQKLVNYLKSRIPEKSFDDKAFEKAVSTKNTLPNGEVYAEAGYITLADVYACFIDRDRAALIIDKIRKVQGLPPISKIVKPTTPPAQVVVVDDQVDEEPAAVSSSKPTINNHKKKHKQQKRKR